VLGTLRMPGIIPHFSATPGSVRHPGAHEPGAFNAAVFGELLGLSDEEQRRLRASGVI
jgi:formyl-CoA transferase